MKKKILVMLFSLILIPLVTAQIAVQDEVVKNVLTPEETASFTLSITNGGSSSDVFGISIGDTNWRDKIEDDFLEVAAGKTAQTEIELTPNKALKPGRYSVNLRVYSRTQPETFIDHLLVVDVIAYEDLISASIESNPDGLDPRRENLIRLNLKNKNSIGLKGIKVTLESSLFEDSREVDFLPAELRNEEFQVNLDENIERGDYDVRILVELNGNKLVDKTEKIKVGSYKDVTDDESVNNAFLLTERKFVKHNSGNIETTETYKARVTTFESYFTSVYPAPTKAFRENGGYYYQWNFILKPGESYKISVSTSYRTPISIVIVTILLLGLLYYTFGTKVSIKKRILTVKSGNNVNMKVLLIVKNESRKALKNLTLIDYLPKGTKVPAEFGVPKPNKVSRGSGTEMLLWRLDNMVKGEERVVSYRVKDNYDVPGIHVPRAIVKYRVGERDVVTKSNKNFVNL